MKPIFYPLYAIANGDDDFSMIGVYSLKGDYHGAVKEAEESGDYEYVVPRPFGDTLDGIKRRLVSEALHGLGTSDVAKALITSIPPLLAGEDNGLAIFR